MGASRRCNRCSANSGGEGEGCVHAMRMAGARFNPASIQRRWSGPAAGLASHHSHCCCAGAPERPCVQPGQGPLPAQLASKQDAAPAAPAAAPPSDLPVTPPLALLLLLLLLPTLSLLCPRASYSRPLCSTSLSRLISAPIDPLSAPVPPLSFAATSPNSQQRARQTTPPPKPASPRLFV
jgi:hypothetical protein